MTKFATGRPATGRNKTITIRISDKKDWPKIRARVIDTDEEVLVDDHPIDFFHTTYYNMWHNTENGMIYHDDELEFIDERLQNI